MSDDSVTVGVDVAVPDAAPTIIHPKTGEIVVVDDTAPTDVLADVRDLLVAHEHEVKSWKRALDRAMIRRLDYEGRRSVEIAGAAGAFKLNGTAPVKTVWDGRTAYVELRRLVRDGLISQDRARECVSRETAYKAHHGPLSQLAKHADERVRDAVERCRSEEVVENRTVSVSRKVTS